MPIANIVDRRKRQYRFLKINAIVEAAWHDNSCKDADQVTEINGPDYAQVEHIDITNAIKWANGYASLVTLYLYDEGDGIYPVKATSSEMGRDQA